MTLWSYMKSKVHSSACCPSSPWFYAETELKHLNLFSGKKKKKPKPVFKGLNGSPPPCNGVVGKYTSGFHLSDRTKSIDVAYRLNL